MILKCIYIDTVDPAFLTLDPKFDAGFLGADTLRPYAAQPEYDMPETFLHRALAAGDECFGIRHGSDLAAYGWYSTTANQFSDELKLHCSPSWVCMYRGFTHSRYRGQRLHAIGMTMALSAYLGRGFKGLVSCVDVKNEASLKSVYRMGYRDFGTIYGIKVGHLIGMRRPRGRLLNRQLILCTPGCRAFGFRLERGTVPGPSLAPHVAHPVNV